MSAQPIPVYVLTVHARREMRRRDIPASLVQRALLQPESRYDVRPGRIVVQSTPWLTDRGKMILLRVFLDVDRDPPEVVTVYKTGKIAKYRRIGP